MEQARKQAIVRLALEKQAGLGSEAVLFGKYLLESAKGPLARAGKWLTGKTLGMADMPQKFVQRAPGETASVASRVLRGMKAPSRTGAGLKQLKLPRAGMLPKGMGLKPAGGAKFDLPKLQNAFDAHRLGKFQRRAAFRRIGGTAAGAAGLVGAGVVLGRN